jgi:hypothetical protein
MGDIEKFVRATDEIGIQFDVVPSTMATRESQRHGNRNRRYE